MYNVSISKNTAMYSPQFQTGKNIAVTQELNPKVELQKVYRSQGLIGKFFDKLQGLLGIGLSKSKLTRNINSPDIDKKINKYYDQQKNSTEFTVDILTGLSAAGTFKLLKKLQTYSHLYVHNKKFELYSSLIGVGISAISGMFLKPILKAINTLGMPKKERKQERTILKDMGSGFLNGAASPLMYAHKAGILGYAAINSSIRYLFNKKADKESGITDHLSNNWLAQSLGFGIAGYSAFKFHKRVDILENAIKKSKENIKNIKVFKGKLPLTELADVAKTNLKDTQTQSELIYATKKGFFSKTYMMLTSPLRKLFGRKNRPIREALELVPKPLGRICVMSKDLIKEQELTNIMREIEQYNIFYPKMLQAMPSNLESLVKLAGDGKNPLEQLLKNESQSSTEQSWIKRKLNNFMRKRCLYVGEKGVKVINDFLNKYKSSCPASRTVQDAQKYVDETFGKQYSIIGEKPLGVGTIAETFLAKNNNDGNEVVIKMVKKWVNADKLNKDKENMLKTIERAKKSLNPDEYEYQKKLVEELYKAWSKEIDLGLEAEAAKTLGKYAVNYNTVAPIAVKNNIFVMEKAKGVEFDKFVEYLEKNNIKLTLDEASDLLRNYFQVFFEQLLSVPKSGTKVMHADPHAGNIFIDINNKEKPFTFIDTGNVMRFTPEEAIQNVTSHLDYLIGNTQNISQRLLKGATLPDNMTEKQAVEMLAKHLDETFFSGKYKIHSDPFSTINNESIDFMKKHKIILNSSNTNLVKAELTYLVNLISIGKIVKHIDANSKFNELEQSEKMKLMGKQILSSLYNGAINNKECTAKEIYQRYKYLRDNPEKLFTTLYSYVPPKSA